MSKVTASCVVWAVAAVLTLGAACGESGEEPQGTTSGTTAATASVSSSSGEVSSGFVTEVTADASSSTADEPPSFPPEVAITADWLERSLTVVDLEAVAAGATTRAEIEVVRIDLSDYAPGPLQVEWVDETRVLVSISPGFYDGIVGNTIGVADVILDGTLLVVDVVEGAVLAELPTAHVPMGLAVSADGLTAYSANYGHSDAPGDTLSVLDLEAGTVSDIVVGARPEQVSLSSDGMLGIVNLAGDGTVRVFETADVEGTLSVAVETSADPSDVDFIPGTSLAVVANSLSPAVYSVLDVSDPAAPVVVHEAEPAGGFPYGITAVPGTTDFVMTIANQGAKFTRVDASTRPPTQAWLVELPEVSAFPLGIAVAESMGVAVAAAPGADALVVLALSDGASTLVRWDAEPPTGPTYVAVRP